MLCGFQLLFPVEFKSLHPATGSCSGLRGRCASSFPCRIAAAAALGRAPRPAHCPRSAPSSLLSPAPAEAQGSLLGAKTPQMHLLGEKSCSSLSRTSELSSQVLFTKYIYLLWETVIPLLKTPKDKVRA